VSIFGWGVGADQEEGHYHDEEGTITGDFLYTYKQTKWTWSFGCGATDCSVSASPSDATYGQDYPATPVNFMY
jgi:hypothetical protein